VSEESLLVNGVDFVVEASVRARGAKRYLYYSIDISVPWRGVCYKRDSTPHWLHDGTRTRTATNLRPRVRVGRRRVRLSS
jgi:hypothetical protein